MISTTTAQQRSISSTGFRGIHARTWGYTAARHQRPDGDWQLDRKAAQRQTAACAASEGLVGPQPQLPSHIANA